MEDERQSTAPPLDRGTATAPAKPRHEWMDVCRGLAVLLIVIVHAGSILDGATTRAIPAWVDALDNALAPYRVPLLIFLSGTFLGHSLAKGLSRFAAGKIARIVWPYLLWTAISVTIAAGPAALLEPWTWVRGGPALWFLKFLILFYAAAVLFARVPVLVIAIYGVAIACIAPQNEMYGDRLFTLMAYFFIGAQVGRNLQAFTAMFRSRWIFALLPVLAGLSYFLIGQNSNVKYSPFIAPLVLASFVFMCALADRLGSGPVARFLKFAGRNSIVFFVINPSIYLLMYNFVLAGSELSVEVLIGVSLAVALAVGAMLALLNERGGAVRYLFELPAFAFPRPIHGLFERLERVFMPAVGARGAVRGTDAGSAA